MRKFLGKAALLAATGLAMSAMATGASAAVTFTFDTGGSNSGGSNAGNVRTFTGSDGTTKVEVTGYSICVGTGPGYNSSCPSSYADKGKIILKQAYVGQYSGYGLGVTDQSENGSSPNHTVDNSGWTDFLVLQFNTSVDVTQLKLTAWGDTDISYAPGSTSTPFSSTLSFANWAAVDAAFDALQSSTGSSKSDGTNFTRSVDSSVDNLFFISAAYPNPDSHPDYVKLKGLTESLPPPPPPPPPPVPEPATWAMMIGGLGLVGLTMRRRKTAVSFA